MENIIFNLTKDNTLYYNEFTLWNTEWRMSIAMQLNKVTDAATLTKLCQKLIRIDYKIRDLNKLGCVTPKNINNLNKNIAMLCTQILIAQLAQ